jgi:hypothetical protein
MPKCLVREGELAEKGSRRCGGARPPRHDGLAATQLPKRAACVLLDTAAAAGPNQRPRGPVTPAAHRRLPRDARAICSLLSSCQHGSADGEPSPASSSRSAPRRGQSHGRLAAYQQQEAKRGRDWRSGPVLSGQELTRRRRHARGCALQPATPACAATRRPPLSQALCLATPTWVTGHGRPRRPPPSPTPASTSTAADPPSRERSRACGSTRSTPSGRWRRSSSEGESGDSGTRLQTGAVSPQRSQAPSPAKQHLHTRLAAVQSRQGYEYEYVFCTDL